MCAVLVAAGCGGTELPSEIDCGEYQEVRPSLLGKLNGLPPRTMYDAAGRSLEVLVGSTDITAAEHDDHTYFCPTVDASFTATLDGVAAQTSSPGQWRCLGPGGVACQTARVGFTGVDPAPSATLVFADRGGTLTYTISITGSRRR